MKIYTCDEKKTKWYKKVDWIKVIITFIILNIVLIPLFYYLISKGKYLNDSIYTSLFISVLLSLGMMIHNVIENRINGYIIKDNKLYIIFPFTYSSNYDDGLISYDVFKKAFEKEEVIKDIIKNTKEYEGFNILDVEKFKYKKKRKYTQLKVIGNAKLWKGVGGIFSFDHFILENKRIKKKFIIPSDYKNYKELVNKFEEQSK